MQRLILMLTFLAGAAQAEPPKVLTDIAPVHSLVAQVMGDLGKPTLLLDATDDIHHFQLRPSQARSLAQADVVFWIGEAMEPWFPRSLNAINPDVVSVVLTEPSHHGEHTWLDVVLVAEWPEKIAASLTGIDPENAETYTANAAAAKARIIALTDDIRTMLIPVKWVGFVVDHDGYVAFSNRFDLNIVASLRHSEDRGPTAGEIRFVRDRFDGDQVDCVFYSVGQTDEWAKTVVEGTDIAIAGLDAVGINLTPGSDLYGELIRNMAIAYRDCVQ